MPDLEMEKNMGIITMFKQGLKIVRLQDLT